ncbi:biotin transport system substrate-specific component [Ruegeria halocynthiae]|uniref:Biotin transporter n=1 Tax=Ruegeria halocynthiae TaxID=985054 RepID=A0A1H3BXJ7_9RHOB|nr:biotin transporter BioY [Ruegeria halocynthiae]SDX45939.1 biotin transport system substrate-specific component [Ruegeria halocynthiae]
MKPMLQSALPATGALSPAGQIIRVVMGILLLTASAKVQVPFWPVPMTLQVAAIMAIAAVFGMRLGSATVIGYMVAGAVGLPVFAGTPEKGIGLAYMLGGTGGYLLGFVVASIIVGWAADNLRKLLLIPAMLSGLAVVYALGLGWLAQFVPADKVLAYGFSPFIVGDLVKIALAAVVVIGLPEGLTQKIRGAEMDA